MNAVFPLRLHPAIFFQAFQEFISSSLSRLIDDSSVDDALDRLPDLSSPKDRTVALLLLHSSLKKYVESW